MYFTAMSLEKPSKKLSPKYIDKIMSHNPEHNNCFLIETQNALTMDSFDHDLNTDPNINYNILETKLTKCYNCIFTKHIPVRFKKNKHLINKWMTPTILKSINYKNKLLG